MNIQPARAALPHSTTAKKTLNARPGADVEIFCDTFLYLLDLCPASSTTQK
jgi:hypothetical protein